MFIYSGKKSRKRQEKKSGSVNVRISGSTGRCVCLFKKKRKKEQESVLVFTILTLQDQHYIQLLRFTGTSLSLSGITVSSPSFLQSAPKRATAQTECANICNAKPFVHDVTKTTCHNKEVFFCFVFFSPEISFDTGRSLHRNRLCY